MDVAIVAFLFVCVAVLMGYLYVVKCRRADADWKKERESRGVYDIWGGK